MNIKSLYTKRYRVYQTMIRAFGHERSLTRYFRRLPLQAGWRILDAGCGAGAGLRAIMQVAKEQQVSNLTLDGFDFLPPAVADLNTLSVTITQHTLTARVADALHLGSELPPTWNNYQLIISSGMLEYLPKPALAGVLTELKTKLAPDGNLIIFISRTTRFNRFFLGGLWQANTYTEDEIKNIFREANLQIIEFSKFNLWGFSIRAR